MADLANQQILWDLKAIMLATGAKSRKSAYKIVAQPDFPRPVQIPGMHPKWFAEEVREYFKMKQAA